jgi:hypothetical protein
MVVGSDRATADDAGTGPDASATDHADATFDGIATIDAAAMVDPGASSDGSDGGATDAAEPDAAVKCDGGAAPYGGLGGVCVTIDLSSYDRSCESDSDCTAVAQGTHCNFDCEGACPNAAINVRGQTCYEQMLPQPYPLQPVPFCECGNLPYPLTRCIDGLCTFCARPGGCPSK